MVRRARYAISAPVRCIIPDCAVGLKQLHSDSIELSLMLARGLSSCLDDRGQSCLQVSLHIDTIGCQYSGLLLKSDSSAGTVSSLQHNMESSSTFCHTHLVR